MHICTHIHIVSLAVIGMLVVCRSLTDLLTKELAVKA